MSEIDYIIEILEKSVYKNGEIALTNTHLLNILKLAQKKYIKEIETDIPL